MISWLVELRRLGQCGQDAPVAITDPMGDLACARINIVLVVVSPLLVLPEVTLSSMMSQDLLGTFAVHGHVHLTQLTVELVHVVLGVKWTRNKVSSPFHVLKVALFQYYTRSLNAVTLQLHKRLIQGSFGFEDLSLGCGR